MASNPVITQTPNPFTPDSVPPNNRGQVIYTDLSYNIVPDISNNPTYTLRTDVADDVFDVFQSSIDEPQAFVPNSQFTAMNLSNPTGMARDSAGNFYVANAPFVGASLDATISVYNSNGVYLRLINVNSGATWSNLRYLAFDDSDNLYASSESSVGIAYIAAGASTNTYANTIFPNPNPFSNKSRGLAFHSGYLYIVLRQTPPYVVKYNVSNNNYVLLNLSTDLSGSSPIAIVYNPFYVSSPTPFLYLTATGIFAGENKIFTISEITGTESLSPGGTGTATITLLTDAFSSTQSPFSIDVDNSGNLYVGLTSLFDPTIGEIARVTATGTISNISSVALFSIGPTLGRSQGLIFDGSLNLFISDRVNSRVIKSRPKTFVFGGPSATSNEANYGLPVTTYLYNISDNVITTTFDLNIVCFKKGSKILCENDIYKPIEGLKIGDLVKTYKHGYQKIIRLAHSRLCDFVQSVYNKMYTYSRESNPELTEDLHLTGGHSLLLDTLTDEESNDMKKIHWPTKEEYMVEDKYKLLACFSRKLYISTEENAEIYHLTLEPPKNAKPSYVYGIYVNGILAESCSQSAMEQVSGQ